MAGWGRGQWGSGRPNKPRGGGGGGGSTGGYSYFNRGNSKGPNQGWQDDGWGYQGYQEEQWPGNSGIGDYGYDEQFGGDMGWQDYDGPQGFRNGSGRPPPRPLMAPMMIGGRGSGFNARGRKRPMEGSRPMGGPLKRRQPERGYGGFANRGQGMGFGGWGGEGYGGYGNDWMGAPHGSGWGHGGYYEGNPYMQEMGAYQGGYEDPRKQEQRNAGKKGKKQTSERSDKTKRVTEGPHDKLLYKKHRTLTKLDPKRNLTVSIKGVMAAIKSASDTLSVEARAQEEVLETKIQEQKSNDEAKKDTATEEAETQEKSSEEVNTEEEKAPEENKTETDKTVKDTEEDKPQEEKSNKETNDKPAQQQKTTVKHAPPQVLTGAIRVGPAHKRLIVKDATDLGEEIVAVFKDKPTKRMLHRLASLIEFNLKGLVADKAVISADEGIEKIVVNLDKFECHYPIHVSLTSPLYSKSDDTEQEPTDVDQEIDESELLSEDKCKIALQKIRRMQWTRKTKQDFELPLVRIFIDFGRRLEGWRPLHSYAAEVLVNTVMTKLAKDVRESEMSMSRVFVQCLEVLAAGLVLSVGPGLKDPCEPADVDIFGGLEPQEAEDLTKAAQSALRLCACGHLEKLLEIE